MIPAGIHIIARSMTSSEFKLCFLKRYDDTKIAATIPVAMSIPYHLMSIPKIVKAIGPGEVIRFCPFCLRLSMLKGLLHKCFFLSNNHGAFLCVITVYFFKIQGVVPEKPQYIFPKKSRRVSPKSHGLSR